MTTAAPLILQRHDRVLVATLNRPDKGNALNQSVIDALDELAATLAFDSADTGALVLTGAGSKAFSVGADVTELDNIEPAAAYRQMRRGQEVFQRLERLPVVVIAAINGYALGGGLELALSADIRIGSSAARLGQPEITLANVPGWGGTQRLPRLIGRAVATELILTGDIIDADRGLSLGLLNRVIDDPLTVSITLGARIAANSPTAVRGAKAAIRIGLDDGTPAGLTAEADAVAACCATDEQHRAVQAFLNRKAKPPSAHTSSHSE